MFAALNSLTCLVMSIEWTPVGSPKSSCTVNCQQAHHTGRPSRCFEDVGKRDMNQAATDTNSWEDIAKQLLETDCCCRNPSGWWEALLTSAREETAQENTGSNIYSCARPLPTNCKNTATPEAGSLATTAVATETDEPSNTVHRLHWLVPSTAAVTKRALVKNGKNRK